MAKIKDVKAQEILDSQGNPTVQAAVTLTDGSVGIASSPSGTSVGSYEAVELRDHDQTRFKGMGVLKAIANIEQVIGLKLIGMDVTKQQEIDKTMIEIDGTQNKARLGANAMLAVSMAVCKAAAKSSVLPLFLYLRQFTKRENTIMKIPTPLFNLINGGKHADNYLEFQEFLIIPATSKSYSEALQLGDIVYKTLMDLLRQKGYATTVGKEGGYAPAITNNQDALLLLRQAIESSNVRMDYEAFLGLDAAANSFHSNDAYHIKEKGGGLPARELVEYYDELERNFHLLYLEDPLAEDDWDSWASLTSKIAHHTLIVGDDLTATNPYRLQTAIDKKSITGIIIKPNQIGTVLEALAVVEVAREAGLKIIVSHRSGETNDDFIADFSIAVSADYVKFGAPARGERVAKYNRLLEIETQLKTLGVGTHHNQ